MSKNSAMFVKDIISGMKYSENNYNIENIFGVEENKIKIEILKDIHESEKNYEYKKSNNG